MRVILKLGDVLSENEGNTPVPYELGLEGTIVRPLLCCYPAVPRVWLPLRFPITTLIKSNPFSRTSNTVSHDSSPELNVIQSARPPLSSTSCPIPPLYNVPTHSRPAARISSAHPTRQLKPSTKPSNPSVKQRPSSNNLQGP